MRFLKENTIVFEKDNYADEAALQTAISETVKHLIENNYAALVHCDDPLAGIYCVSYAYEWNTANGFGGERYILVTADEAEDLLAQREEKEMIQSED
jgi:hypothetical protein